MTEDEAKTKWCPFARERAAQGMPDGGGNRSSYGGADDGPVEDDYTREQAMLFPCIASACMAWRWSFQTQAIDGTWNVHETKRTEARTSVTRDGFCGPAGRP